MQEFYSRINSDIAALLNDARDWDSVVFQMFAFQNQLKQFYSGVVKGGRGESALLWKFFMHFVGKSDALSGTCFC